MARGSFPSRNDLTQQHVRELFDYNPDTGYLICRKQNPGPRRPGDIVGRLRSDGYLGCGVLVHEYLVHRLIWLWVYGKWPANEIDHINGVKNDNRLVNLRDVSINNNNGNILRAKSHNKLGLLGVRLYKGKYISSIKKDHKSYHLGTYDTKEEASQAYWKAREEKGRGRMEQRT